jgi:hypothetical protein
MYVKAGTSSLRFTTASGFDTGIAYPKFPTASWDLTSVNYLTFWARAENNTPIGFQGNQPVLELKTPTGTFRYTPHSQLLTNNTWVKIRIPLAGGDQWTRSTTGTPTLTNVSQLLIHDDTWDYGFAITFDRIQFEQLDPNGLPPAGPQSPAGVNPDVIQPRILLYVFDPIMENLGGQRLHAAYGWQNPEALTNQAIADLRNSSHGILDYQIAETVIADVHPYFTDGFQNTDTSFVTNWNNRDFHEGFQFDYVRFANENDIAARIDAGEIDEVWIYAPPIAGLWESTMGGAGAYWINGPTQPIPSQRAFAIMGLNYERGVGEAIHSFGHRTESVMAHIYGAWQANQDNNWNRFTSLNKDQPGLGGVGNVHFPVNGTSDYDYFNQQYVMSNADAWVNYPHVVGDSRLINAREWSPNGNDPQREYLNWWYSHLPHTSGRGTDFYLNNWWRYIADLDQFKGGNGNLQLTEGQPRTTISSPSTAPANSTVIIGADVDVDGALGRVDFYVDGQYIASDTVAPYVFSWNTTGMIGNHVVLAKAYELQNGTEGVSNAATILVTGTPDMGDFDQDGDVDGRDFLLWQRNPSVGSLADWQNNYGVEELGSRLRGNDGEGRGNDDEGRGNDGEGRGNDDEGLLVMSGELQDSVELRVESEEPDTAPGSAIPGLGYIQRETPASKTDRSYEETTIDRYAEEVDRAMESLATTPRFGVPSFGEMVARRGVKPLGVRSTTPRG